MFEVVKRVLPDATFESESVLHNGQEIAWTLGGSIALDFDRLPIVIDCILAFLGSRPQRKRLTLVTNLEIEVYLDMIVRRLFHELGVERVRVICCLATPRPRHVEEHTFLRSEFVPEWCTRYIMLLQEKLPLELIRLLTSMLFYWITN
jgi:hypothetical protein